MAQLSVQGISRDGLSPSFQAAGSGGDSFANDGKVFLHVKNGDTVNHVVTVNAAKPCNYGTYHNLVVTVPAGEERIIGLFPTYRFNDDNENVQVSYDGVTSVTVAVFSVD